MGSGKEPRDKHSKHPPEKSGAPAAEQAPKPEWADGLRKMYDSVVEEPLPDSFRDLLSKLDQSESDGES